MSDLVVRPSRSREATRQLWSDRLDRFSSSGLSVIAFCKAEGVCSHSFYYWKRLLAAPLAPPQPARLLPVTLQPSGSAVEVVLPTGPVLRLQPGCDLDFVRSVVSALGGQPC
jgi:hypothetical protein